MNGRLLLASLVLLATVLFALAPLYRHGDVPIAIHHLLHALILFGAALAALLFTWPGAPRAPGRVPWLLITLLSPLAAMLLMWPSEYSVFEREPALHALQHLGLVLFGFLTAYAGQRFAAGIGIAMSATMLLMGLLAAGGFGVSPPLQVH